MAKKKGEAKTPEELHKEMEQLVKNYEKLDSFILEQRSGWDSISATLFQINQNDFFAKVKRSAEQTADIAANLKASQAEILSTGKALGDSISGILKGNQKQYQNIAQSFSGHLDELAKKNALMAESLRKGLTSKDLTLFFQTFGKEGMEAFQDIVNDKKGYASLKKWFETDAIKHWEVLIDKTDDLKNALNNSTEEVFSMRKALVTTGEYFTRAFIPNNILPKLHDFDQILNDTQKNFGLAMDANSAKFTELIGQNQIFGLGAQDNAQFMGMLGENLRTTNFDVLSDAAKSMGVLHLATGLSVDEMNNLGTQLMFYGKTAQQVRDFTEDTMQMAQKYGLNAKKVLQEVIKALPDSRKLGWQGGANALAEMVMQAQKLGQNIDDLTNSAKKLRTLEGSIEASADLALVGINTNAIQMLAAARRGGKEFSSFIGDVTKGIGQIKKDGSVEFDPIDIDRLNVIADAVGIPLEKLQDQVAQTAQRNAKINLFPPSMFGSLTPEQIEFVLNATQLSEDGTLKFSGELGNITHASQISGNMLKTLMDNRTTLDQQAEQNKSFNDSVKDFKASIMNIFTYLQPFITTATSVVTTINNLIKGMSETGKKAFASLLLFSAIFFSVAKHYLAGFSYGQGFNSAVNKGGFLSGFGKLLNKFNPTNWFRKAEQTVTTATNPPNLAGASGPNPQSSKNIGSFAEALKAMPSPSQLLALAAAILAVGAAFIGIGFGIKLAAEGLAELVKSFNDVTNAGYALTSVSIVMAGFVGMLALMIPIIGALGATAIAVWPGLLALGAAFVGMGFGIKLATDGMANLVNSFKGLENSSAAMWSIVAVMGSFVAISAMLIPNLIGLGAALGTFGALGWIAVPPLLALGAAAIGIGYGIKIAADGFSNLVKSFDGINNSIPALLSVVTVMGSVTAVMLGLIPVVGLLGPALAGFGALGLTAIPPLLALGAAAIAIGYGINIASQGFAKLVESFGGITNALPTLLSLTSIVGGLTLSLFAIIPAISALSASLVAFGGIGAIAAIPLLVLGAASIGIGYGIKLATSSISDLISKLNELSNIKIILSALGLTITGFVGGIFALTPAISALSLSLISLGGSGLISIPVLLALSGAVIGIGYGIKLSISAISELLSKLEEFSNIKSTIKTTGFALSGFTLSILGLLPAISGLSIGLSGLGLSGLIAIPVLFALGAAATGIGFGINLATSSLIDLISKFKDLSNAQSVVGALGITMAGFAGILFTLTPAISALGASLFGLGISGLIAIPIILSLGAAAVGIGYGINLVIKSFSELIEKLEKTSDIKSTLIALGVTAVALTGSFFTLSPAISAITTTLIGLGISGSIAIPVLLALSGAAVGIGYGINLAVQSFVELISKIKEVSNFGSIFSVIGLSLAGFAGSLLALPPLLTALGVSLTTLGASGLIAIPALIALSGTILGIGFGINLASRGVVELVKSFSDIKNATPILFSVFGIIGGLTASVYALIPAISGLGFAFASFGTLGSVAILPLLALGAATLGVGYSLKLIIGSLSELFSQSKGISNINNLLISLGISVAGLVGGIFALTPALSALSIVLTTLGTVGIVAAPVLLSLGAAAVGVGFGIKLISDGVSNLIKSFKNVDNESFGLAKAGGNVSILTVSILGLIPAIFGLSSGLASFGTASTIAVPGLLALGAAAVGVGFGIKLASDGIATLVNSISGLENSSSVFATITTTLAGMTFSALTLIPMFSGLSIALTSLTASGLIAAPVLIGLGIAASGIGFGIDLMANATTKLLTSLKDISIGNNALTSFGTTMFGLVGSLIVLSPLLASLSAAFVAFSSSGALVAPVLLTIGASSVVFGYGMKLIGEGITSVLTPFTNFLTLSEKLAGTNNNLNSVNSTLKSFIPTLSEFGLLGIVSAPGIWLINSAISSLANEMQRLANPIDVANKSLSNMVDNTERLKSAIQNLDTEKFMKLSSNSDNFIKSSLSVNTISNNEAQPAKPSKITFSPLVIDLKINGRDYQELVIKDLQYTS